jgi:hypothetical protein
MRTILRNELLQQMVAQAIHNQLKFKYILADSWFASAANMRFIKKKKKFLHSKLWLWMRNLSCDKK